MAREYLIWNVTVASLLFWTADLDLITLSTTTEEVFSAFFYTTLTYMLHWQSDEVLFGHFMTTLSTAFEWKLALEDEGYKSSSKKLQHTNSLKKSTKK